MCNLLIFVFRLIFYFAKSFTPAAIFTTVIIAFSIT